MKKPLVEDLFLDKTNVIFCYFWPGNIRGGKKTDSMIHHKVFVLDFLNTFLNVKMWLALPLSVTQSLPMERRDSQLSNDINVVFVLQILTKIPHITYWLSPSHDFEKKAF